MKDKSICYVAGHSGGHIIPSITHAKKELEHNSNTKILFFCTNAELDKKILEKHEFLNTVYLPITNIPKNKLLLPKFCINLLVSFVKSLYLLKKHNIKNIISMGGLVSLPVCFAGKILGISIQLYELNVEPGKAINLLSKLTTDVNICFPVTQKYFPKTKCNLVSYPVRFNNDIKNITQEAALQKINLNAEFKTILVLGGSQGSLFLNNLIKQFVKENSNLKLQIIHQTGQLDNFDWQSFYKELNIPAITFDYHHEPEYYYIACDIIICRSGAGTLAEILFFQKKCLTIPLQTSYTNHQKYNALELEKLYPDLIHVIEQNKVNNLDIKKLI
ncbi:MAG: UDP-N-acetylglucosamine--N-acetylmuramyl-(pentapeptide) pyrophosphoryl-undecaprenol N-acetylglucosamine transferase [Candidatus Babeliales bacterium]|nr:UDP-N-acetylglucosamine--N-acetylmuramyl-(pentapeptide) pyrophosphoryl-undecaprenol N-acetylglucosamine transferase [Candidatus Babeliales bacterium]